MSLAPIADIVPGRIVRSEPISAGVGGEVHRVWLEDGSTVIAKLGRGPDLRIEARMIDLLTPWLPMPGVLASRADALVMEDVAHDGGLTPGAERDAARLLAGLHAVESPDGRYGLGEDNLIGPLPQRNAPADGWVEFWHRRRIAPMVERGARSGRLHPSLRRRVEALAHRLGELVPERPRPSLIHGDIWSGNVLCRAGRIAAFIDPSPYHADREVELAFITLFSTFSAGFFAAYAERSAIDAGFVQTRRLVYIVYPLLVHIELFGGGYSEQLSGALRELGF